MVGPYLRCHSCHRPLSISGPLGANAAGTTPGTGWLRLGPLDGTVQIGGTQQLTDPPAPLTVLGPIATHCP